MPAIVTHELELALEIVVLTFHRSQPRLQFLDVLDVLSSKKKKKKKEKKMRVMLTRYESKLKDTVRITP